MCMYSIHCSSRKIDIAQWRFEHSLTLRSGSFPGFKLQLLGAIFRADMLGASRSTLS